MFDSVLGRGVTNSRRLAIGAMVSIFGHATVLSLALMVRPPMAQEKENTKVIMWPTNLPMFTPAAAPGPAGGGGARGAGHAARAIRHRELLAPAAVPTSIDVETEAPPDLGGPDTAEVVGKKIGDADAPPGGGGGTGGDGTCVGNTCDVQGMTAPKLLDRGREPDYTPEALEAHVQGLMTVQCVVTLEGRLQQCQALQSLPFMELAVVEALMTRRYTPATLHGRPLAVRYVFHVKLVMPR